MDKIRDILDDLFNFPRTFLAWIVFHLASWLDMRVIENNDEDDFITDLLEEISEEELEEEIEDRKKRGK